MGGGEENWGGDSSGFGRNGKSRDIGGGGAGRTGARSRRLGRGGFGGARCGIMMGGIAGLANALADGLFGMGGAARGFSKLPSWFCGNLGLAGGDMMPVFGEKEAGKAPTLGVVIGVC